jgi:hypothetical protein
VIAAGHILAVLRAGKKIGASGQEKAVKLREAKESSFLVRKNENVLSL